MKDKRNSLPSLMMLVLCCAVVWPSTSSHGAESSSARQPGTELSDEELRKAVAPMRAGRKLTPKTWPGGARVAVCLTWDMDNETLDLRSGNLDPIILSDSEYGATGALQRILSLYDRHDIPGSFYIPAVAAMLHPDIVAELRRRPQHEIGIHGWIHESLPELNDQAEERQLLGKAIEFWVKATGRRPVGFRAPGWAFSQYTLAIIRAAGFKYDSSAMAMDEPYEIVSNGETTGLIEIPVTWVLDDALYFGLHYSSGASPSPEIAFKVFRDEFDEAYKEGTLFMLTMHPMISGRRSRMKYLDNLVAYMKSKPGVWFATAEQIANYVQQMREPF